LASRPHGSAGRETVVSLAISRADCTARSTVGCDRPRAVAAGRGNYHLRVLAGIATLLRSPELREALLSAPDAPAALQALDHHARSAPPA
jgi:mannitol/fructose-specific phosphotransferase system IIA component (Ntr-type)